MSKHSATQLSHFQIFVEVLLELGITQGKSLKDVPIAKKFSDIPKPQVMLPLVSMLSIAIPDTVDKSFNPFPSNPILAHSIDESFTVMASAQKPKKITIRTIENEKYNFLVKQNDDLRKDSRMMEFFGLLNRLFKRDAECKKRQLCKFCCSVLIWYSNSNICCHSHE